MQSLFNFLPTVNVVDLVKQQYKIKLLAWQRFAHIRWDNHLESFTYAYMFVEKAFVCRCYLIALFRDMLAYLAIATVILSVQLRSLVVQDS